MHRYTAHEARFDQLVSEWSSKLRARNSAQTGTRRLGFGPPRVLGPRWLVPVGLSLLAGLGAFAQQPTITDPAWHQRRAQEALERKDYDTAVDAWKAIAALLPDVPEARSNLGLMYHLKRSYELAIPEFRSALQQDPRLLAAKVFLGVDYYLTSQPEKAIRELTGALSIDPRNTEARKWLSLSYCQTGNLVECIVELNAWRELDPSNSEPIFHLGRAYRRLSTQPFVATGESRFESAWFFRFRAEQFVQQENIGKALEEFRDAARADPRIPDVDYQIGKLLEGQGNALEAARHYALELVNFPSHLPAASNLIRLLRQSGMRSEATRVATLAGRVHRHRPQALKSLTEAAGGPSAESTASTAGNEADGIRELLSRLSADTAPTWAEGVRAALLADEPTEARALVRDAEANAASGRSAYWRARSQLDLGQPDEALKTFLALHEGDPSNQAVAYYLQRCANGLALESLELFVSREPDSYRTHQLEAEFHAARGDDGEAIGAYQRALALKPGAPQLHLEIGTLHLSHRRYDEAVAAFQAELENDAFSVPALTRLGEAYYFSGRTDEAEVPLGRAIEIAPKAAPAYKILGQVRFRQRNYAKAAENLRIALGLGIRDDETIHYHLGRALGLIGDAAGSAEHLAIAEKLRGARNAVIRGRFEDPVQ